MMFLSFLLAVAMMANGAPMYSGPPVQDTSKPEGAPQNPAPPAEQGKGEPEKKEEPAKTSEGTKKPDDSKKADETSKPAESEKPSATDAPPAIPAGKNVKPSSQREPRKVVIRRGGALEPNARISPDLPPEEALKQRQRAEEMVLAAEDRLKLLAGRTLPAPQQETTTQIRNYIEKARSALKDGDTQRGHTLALKAYLLADDLVKH